jgi:hypothetical protein
MSDSGRKMMLSTIQVLEAELNATKMKLAVAERTIAALLEHNQVKSPMVASMIERREEEEAGG